MGSKFYNTDQQKHSCHQGKVVASIWSLNWLMNLRASLLVSADRSRRDPARTSPSCFIALVFNSYSLSFPSGYEEFNDELCF
jgi:hypothetical protein